MLLVNKDWQKSCIGRAVFGPEFMLILGLVGLGHFACGSGPVGSRKLDPRLLVCLLAAVLQETVVGIVIKLSQ